MGWPLVLLSFSEFSLIVLEHVEQSTGPQKEGKRKQKGRNERREEIKAREIRKVERLSASVSFERSLTISDK